MIVTIHGLYGHSGGTVILAGTEIASAVKAGRIRIDPFAPELVNPNSYNYRLARRLLVLNDSGAWTPLEIPDTGFLLNPRRLYLGATHEVIGSAHYVTNLIGRSSLGRLGVFLQASAGLGNLGTPHAWTLEISVVQPTRVYALMPVGQVSFWVPIGAHGSRYAGRYTNYSNPQPCELPIRTLHRRVEGTP